MFYERVFPGVLAEVVLLLADGAGPTHCIKGSQARNRRCAGLWYSDDGPAHLLAHCFGDATCTSSTTAMEHGADGPHLVGGRGRRSRRERTGR